MHDGSWAVKGGLEVLDQDIKEPKVREQSVCGFHWVHEEQEYMGDEDDIDQVMEDDD